MKYGKEKKNSDLMGATAEDYFSKIDKRAEKVEKNVERWAKNRKEARKVLKKLMLNKESAKEEIMMILLTAIIDGVDKDIDPLHYAKELIKLLDFNGKENKADKGEDEDDYAQESLAIRKLLEKK